MIFTLKSIAQEKQVSKRTILSEITQLFDPLGLLGQVIIIAKLILQDLWKYKLDWDETIPERLHTNWLNFKTDLNKLDELKIPRKVIVADAIDIQLHGFCDASEHAYGACVYVRSKNEINKQYSVNLVCAKSRVAPVKTITIARLELCAALLLSQLIEKVSTSLKLHYNKIYLWSDFTIVFYWIKTSLHLLKTSVANRISEIQSKTNNCEWRHVSTTENSSITRSNAKKFYT